MKRIILIIFAISLVFTCYADEIIVGFENEDLPVVNENFRQLRDNTRDNATDISSNTTLATTQIVENTVSNTSRALNTWADLVSQNITTNASNLLIQFSAGDTYVSADGCVAEFRIQVDGVTKTGAIYGVDSVGSVAGHDHSLNATGTGSGTGSGTASGTCSGSTDSGEGVTTDCDLSVYTDVDTDVSVSGNADMAESHTHTIANWRIPVSLQKYESVSADTHTVKVQWRRTGTGTVYIGNTYGAQLTIVELRK